MATLYDVYPNEHIEKIAEELKKFDSIKPPVWAKFVKTGVHRERPPVRLDWWYMRAASLLRKIYIMGPIGVSKLRTKYGGKQRRGHDMPMFKKGSGNIIRKVLQQLEKAELVKYKEIGLHKGRVIAPKGVAILDKTANELAKAMPKPERKPKQVQQEEIDIEESVSEEKIKEPKPVRKRAPAKKKPVEPKAEIKPVEKQVEAKTEIKPAEKPAEPKAESKPVEKPAESE